MVLGNFFIILSVLILIPVISLYIYRKTVFNSYYSKKDIEYFSYSLRDFINTTYPKIPFSFLILEQTKHIQNIAQREEKIIKDIVQQYAKYEYLAKTQNVINKTLLWSSYEIDSKPFKNKVPIDLKRRKNLAWKRANYSCDRCGLLLKNEEALLLYVKDINKGGTYHLENLAIVCEDCLKIHEAKDINKTTLELKIFDILYNRYL